MYYLYINEDGVVRIWRFDSRDAVRSAKKLARRVMMRELGEEYIDSEILFYTNNIDLVKRELYRPYKEEGCEFDDIDDMLEVWLHISSRNPTDAEMAKMIGSYSRCEGGWQFAVEDSRGDTIVFDPPQ